VYCELQQPNREYLEVISTVELAIRHVHLATALDCVIRARP